MTRIRIFIASPGDVSEERDVVSLVVQELDRIATDLFDTEVQLEAVRWETHAWPDIGLDVQDVINKEIGEYDILVGVMWKRFGTPTKRAGSGTVEEFERAYDYNAKYGRPKIMFYFRTAPFYADNLAEITQFRKVIQFRKRLEKASVFYWQYRQPIEFERNVREHLLRQIVRFLRPFREGEGTVPPKDSTMVRQPNVFLSYAREDLDRIRPIYEALKVAGFVPWIDVENLLPGQAWADEIRKAIEDAEVLLVFLSEASQSSGHEHGWLQRELEIALAVYRQQSESKLLIPVRLDPVEMTPLLAVYQWLDYFAPNGLERLVSAINQFWKARKKPESAD